MAAFAPPGTATLKDLAPAEKRKVARLIRQVVDKERALKEVEAAAGAGSDDSRVEALEEQNRGLARENTSLRAKLSHTFDLLRTYQHKVRVLDATVAVTGSRPVTPLGGTPPAPALVLPAAAAAWPARRTDAVDAPLLAAQLGSLALRGGSEGCDASACSLPCSAPLSPVAEAACEGASPSPEKELSSGSLQLVDPHAALPQLETLKLLARALLEAQAEVVARQPSHLQSQRGKAQQPATQQLWATACAACCDAPGPATAATPVTLPGARQAAQLVFDPWLGPCGVCLISPQRSAACSEQGGDTSRLASSSVELPSGAVEHSKVAVHERVPLAVLLQQQQQQQQQQGCADASKASSSCSGALPPPCPVAHSGSGSRSGRPSVFDDGLMDLVQDVEKLTAGQAASAVQGGFPLGAGQASGRGWCGSATLPEDAAGTLYEENDLLALLEHL